MLKVQMQTLLLGLVFSTGSISGTLFPLEPGDILEIGTSSTSGYELSDGAIQAVIVLLITASLRTMLFPRSCDLDPSGNEIARPRTAPKVYL